MLVDFALIYFELFQLSQIGKGSEICPIIVFWCGPSLLIVVSEGAEQNRFFFFYFMSSKMESFGWPNDNVKFF